MLTEKLNVEQDPKNLFLKQHENSFIVMTAKGE